MNYKQFLDEVINRGIAAAKADYTKPSQKDKLAGSIAGFETCRTCTTPAQLKDVLEAARTATKDAYFNDDKTNYWWYRCYELEVEFVCNVVSAMLMNQGQPVIIQPTCRGVMEAVRITGVEKQ